MPAGNFSGVRETPDFICGSPPVYPAGKQRHISQPRNASIFAAAGDAIGVSLGNQLASGWLWQWAQTISAR
jgi:hypothetical protein